MAFAAVERGVLALQLERALLMRRAVVFRWFVALLVVARRAVGAGGSGGKLAVVLILVALLAALMRDRAMEVAVLVTRRAGQLRVFSQQFELGLIMLEAGGRFGLLPGARRVAAIAAAAEFRFLERPMMRIVVAVLATR